MKKILFLGVIICTSLTAFFLVACNKEKEQLDDLKLEFEQASLLHNEAMDYVLSSFRKSGAIDGANILKSLEEYSVEFVDSKKEFFGTISEPKKILSNEIDRLMTFKQEVKYGSLKSTYNLDDYLIYTMEYYANSITPAQSHLLHRINDIIDVEDDQGIILTKLSVLLNIECQNLPIEDRYLMYAAITTGIQSIDYWYSNLNDWVMTFNYFNESFLLDNDNKSWFSWKSLGKSDIAGAIGGAIGGALVGSVAGGVGAGPGAVAGFVGGGIGASASDAVYQVLDHFLK